jgi:hypothetical protein
MLNLPRRERSRTALRCSLSSAEDNSCNTSITVPVAMPSVSVGVHELLDALV